MTATPKLLVAAQDLSNASASIYTSPANGKGTWIDKATSTNHSGAAQTVTVNHVPAAGSAASSNLIVNAKSIADKTTDLLPELVGKFIPAGASLYALASAAAAVNIELNGRELT
jgi:hypothetical protein